jgi:hypothetical protein
MVKTEIVLRTAFIIMIVFAFVQAGIYYWRKTR